jgi:hypothetical protein
MAKRRYIKDFAKDWRIPYLGMAPGLVHCDDVSTLPAGVRAVSLMKKVKGIEKLSTCKRLRRLSTELRPDWLLAIASIPNLQHVKFRMPRLADIPSLTCLAGLRSLVLSCNRHQEDLEFVRGMHWLHSLCVSEATSVSSFAPLATLTELRELYIDGKMGGPRQRVESFSPLGMLSNLRYAVLLVAVAGEKRRLKPLCKLKQLNYLYLQAKFTPAEYDAVLMALPRLKMIRFNGGRRWPSD